MLEHFFTARRRSACRAALLIAGAQASLLIAPPSQLHAEPAPSGGSAPSANPAPVAPAAPTTPAAKSQDGASAGGSSAPTTPAPTTLAPSGAKPLPPIPVKTVKPKVRRAPPPVQRIRAPAAPRATAPAPAPRTEPQPQPQPQTTGEPQITAVGGVGEAAGGTIGSSVIKADVPVTNNTADVLRSVPGVSVYTGGGVSDLPVVHGLNDERVNTTINGMPTPSACANHMNPALSYVDPGSVKRVEVIAGVSSVSSGGDSLGSVIAVEKLPPSFASEKDELVVHGSVSAYVRSASTGIGGNAMASAATPNFSAVYMGAWSRASNYVDGHGDPVESTSYEAENHALTLGFKGTSDVLVVDGGFQIIPYEGFVNQWMDLISNQSWYVNARYERKMDWGKIFAQGYYQDINHFMDFLTDKFLGRRYGYGVNTPRMPYMPMLTAGKSMGYNVKAEIPLTVQDTLRVGNELQRFTLDDWWPPVGNAVTGAWVPGGMMCCDTFWNINNGERTRLGTFVELESKWTPEWTTLVGARNDDVWMDTGPVQGYSAIYATDARLFNLQDHNKNDVNFDATALVRYQPEKTDTYELGYARKTRSPNLYERYAWSTNPMAMQMIGWFGDSNGYVGNLALEPEVANTASFTAGWTDRTGKDWQFKATPYYTYVQDYINVDLIRANCPVATVNGQCPFLPTWPGQNVLLRFANHDAQLYGVDFSGVKLLLNTDDFGSFSLLGTLGVVHGMVVDTGDSLYHMMPVNSNLTLQQKWGNWTNSIEFQLVAEKEAVDPIRRELPTGGYGLINLRSKYEWEHFRVDFGVENVLNKYYEPPLGGVDIGMQPLIYPWTLPVHNVPGMGRNYYVGLTAKF